MAQRLRAGEPGPGVQARSVWKPLQRRGLTVRKSRFSARRHSLGRHCPHTAQKERPMEAERSNAIRSQLEDLTTRVAELRRYL
jgi:hypothetical protein